jgi:hypoxanthine phosphoribosyltransferase
MNYAINVPKEAGLPDDLKTLREIAKQINSDYQGKSLYVLCVLENAFMFTADLVRAIDLPVICEFIKPMFSETAFGTGTKLDIFFQPEKDVTGHHVLLVEGILQAGITSEFLTRTLLGRGAASVKVATFLDRQAARRVAVQPDYFGFLVAENYVVGYGLGGPHLGRNLEYVAATTIKAPEEAAV